MVEKGYTTYSIEISNAFSIPDFAFQGVFVLILTHDYLSQSLRHSLYESVTSYRQRVINENRQIFEKNNKFDIFLSHSFLDRDEVTNLVALFNKCGYSAYVDWMYDPQLDRSNVTKKTAEKLRQTMNQSQGLTLC